MTEIPRVKPSKNVTPQNGVEPIWLTLKKAGYEKESLKVQAKLLVTEMKRKEKDL